MDAWHGELMNLKFASKFEVLEERIYIYNFDNWTKPHLYFKLLAILVLHYKIQKKKTKLYTVPAVKIYYVASDSCNRYMNHETW